MEKVLYFSRIFPITTDMASFIERMNYILYIPDFVSGKIRAVKRDMHHSLASFSRVYP
jgi:hypothetical protein